MRAKRNKNLAFTLMELVIAISVFAVILTLSYRIFSQVASSKQILDEERDISKVAYSILTRFTREIQHAVSRQLIPRPGTMSSSFSSTVYLLGVSKKMSNRKPGAEITFVAKDVGQFIRGSRPGSGLVQITYRVEENPEATEKEDETMLLIRDEINHIPDKNLAFRNILTFPVTDNIEGLQLVYYDNRQKTWKEEWSPQERELPGLIKFNLELRGKSGKIYPYNTIFTVKR